MPDIPLYKTHIPPGSAAAIDRVLQSGQIAGDGNVPEFEAKLKSFLGAQHLCLTAEFSRSIEMTLRMAGVGPGDSVLVSPQACLASTTPILQVGARPIWCDIDAETGNIDPQEIVRRQQANTKAVLLYHWVGYPAEVQQVLKIAGENGLKVVEDAGEAMGAELDDIKIGAHGCDYSLFSFSPVRHITTGEGAAITFNSPEQRELAVLWRRYGIPATGFRDSLGELSRGCEIRVSGFHNYMNRMAGALGTLQMACLPGIVEAHRANGRFYDQALTGISGLKLLKRPPRSVPSYWVYSFRCERRDDLLRKLRENYVHASAVHLRNDVYSCFGTGAVDYPGVTCFEKEQLSIPCGWWVTEADRNSIAETIRKGW